MKDVTSTSFGLLIAYLLPGLAGFYAASFWSLKARKVLDSFLDAKADVGLFFLILLVALTIGLCVSVIRAIIFEEILCKQHRINTALFKNAGDESTLLAFRAAIDEHYRYHQFYGGMTVILPFLYIGWLRQQSITYTGDFIFLMSVGFLYIECALGWKAINEYKSLAIRASSILGGKANAKA